MYILYHFLVCVSNHRARFLVVVCNYVPRGTLGVGWWSLCVSASFSTVSPALYYFCSAFLRSAIR
jgi:hypothetical protein